VAATKKLYKHCARVTSALAPDVIETAAFSHCLLVVILEVLAAVVKSGKERRNLVGNGEDDG
jgi:hypothetical protein